MALATSGLTTHIFNNNLKSGFLLAGFPFLIFLMVFAFQLALYYFGANAPHMASPAATGQPIDAEMMTGAWQDTIYLSPYIFLGVLVWFGIAWFFHARMIRAASGAVPVTREEFPDIYNMLENLCISRGVTMPHFNVIDSPALNAFASGINQRTYSITLTRGIIQALEPDELRAVIAHELTHIMNRDVRLMMVAIIFVGIFSFLAELAFRSLLYGRYTAAARYGNQRGRSGVGIIIVLIGLIILGIGYLFAILIRFAISRRREYLADAGAVELTKDPAAMMRALMRISNRAEMKDMPRDMKQLCIENASHFMGMFASHPPIEKRIQVLSELTRTPVPELPVTLRRPPRRPWDRNRP